MIESVVGVSVSIFHMFKRQNAVVIVARRRHSSNRWTAGILADRTLSLHIFNTQSCWLLQRWQLVAKLKGILLCYGTLGLGDYVHCPSDVRFDDADWINSKCKSLVINLTSWCTGDFSIHPRNDQGASFCLNGLYIFDTWRVVKSNTRFTTA